MYRTNGPGALCCTDPDLYAFLTEAPNSSGYWSNVNWDIVNAHLHKCAKCFTNMVVMCQEQGHPKLGKECRCARASGF